LNFVGQVDHHRNSPKEEVVNYIQSSRAGVVEMLCEHIVAADAKKKMLRVLVVVEEVKHIHHQK